MPLYDVRKSVLISGASITGPALAYWLHRYGFAVTVVERAATLRPGGHAVDLRGVARDVVERMGVMPRVRRDSVDERGIAMIDRKGRKTATMPADLFGGEGIVAEIEIMRGDLSRILYEATSGDVEYLFGDRIAGLTQDRDGVEARFAGGAGRRVALVVGADGGHSGGRALSFRRGAGHVRHL